MKKPIAITAGEPSGIGYNILIQAAQQPRNGSPWLIFADPEVLKQRAKLLNLPLNINLFEDFTKISSQASRLTVWPTPCTEKVLPGKLAVQNANAVINGLSAAAACCMQHQTAALLTLAVHKGIINQAGFRFIGHTEFFAELAAVKKVVMMLASNTCRVALVTTHLPLNKVSAAITETTIRETVLILIAHLKRFYSLTKPKLLIAGLNPHAGEGGHLGNEEVDIIIPTLKKLRTEVDAILIGPLAADTLFQAHYLNQADAIVAMYHDQGLAPLKALSFGNIANITCGLPFIRTSVDHGVALDIAETGNANSQSFLTALGVTESMILQHIYRGF